MPRGTSSAGVAVKFVTSGSYQREVSVWNDFTMTVNVENEVTGSASAVNGLTKDELYSWVRHWFAIQASDEPSAYEWFQILCLSSDALQDMSDSAVVEGLQVTKKILARGLVHHQPHYLAYGTKLIKTEYFNLKMPYGWELRTIVRPLRTNTTNHAQKFEIIEYRKVGA